MSGYVLMSRDEMVRAMVSQGVPRIRAEHFADETLTARRASVNGGVAVEIAQAAMQFPLCFSVPWSALCSDNDKYSAAVGRNGTTHYAQLILTPKYRAAKSKARDAARVATNGAGPVAIPLAITVAVYVPNRHAHDVCNLAKCLLDALETVVYANDGWLHAVTITRAGVDVDRPRAEITVTPL